jgi:hypothetical protein
MDFSQIVHGWPSISAGSGQSSSSQQQTDSSSQPKIDPAAEDQRRQEHLDAMTAAGSSAAAVLYDKELKRRQSGNPEEIPPEDKRVKLEDSGETTEKGSAQAQHLNSNKEIIAAAKLNRRYASIVNQLGNWAFSNKNCSLQDIVNRGHGISDPIIQEWLELSHELNQYGYEAYQQKRSRGKEKGKTCFGELAISKFFESYENPEEFNALANAKELIESLELSKAEKPAVQALSRWLIKNKMGSLQDIAEHPDGVENPVIQKWLNLRKVENYFGYKGPDPSRGKDAVKALIERWSASSDKNNQGPVQK